MSRAYRLGQILKLIRSKSIYTQEELGQELKALGIRCTQASLSRDVRQLRLLKGPEGYRESGGEDSAIAFETLAAEFLRDVRLAQNLVLLQTAPGHASSVAVALDNEEWPEVVGTIAGDDTVLVVAPDNATAEALHTRLRALLETG
jgi:transcriptional regulator of arginine metabolism